MRIKIIENEKTDRIISKFLFIPKIIGDEMRWLERASIEQKLHRMFDVTCGASWSEWRDVKWR